MANEGSSVTARYYRTTDTGNRTAPVVTKYADRTDTPSNIMISHNPNEAFWLENITCHFDAIPITPGEFTITLRAAGNVRIYDVVLYTTDPSTATPSSTDNTAFDIIFMPSRAILCEKGDQIVITYPNGDAIRYGIRVVSELG